MKLFFRKYGSGPPMVILHGLYGSSDNWVTIAKSISERYTVFLPDLRNHGLSPHSDDHNYQELSNDIHELAGDLIPGKFILVGHSMGGKAAMRYALDWPETLNSLVVIDISPFGTTDPENEIRLQHKEILETILSVNLAGLKSRDEIEDQLALKIDSEKIRSLIMKNIQRTATGSFEWKLNASVLLSNLNRIMEGVIPEDGEFESVTGFPVTFIKGEKSEYLNNDEMNRIRLIFPVAEMVIIKGAGHWINAEKPEEMIKILLSLS